MRYVLTVSYDGTRFSGWQRQKNALSVQEVMENALRDALQGDYVITASGRTDAGVHAAGQVCHFDAEGLTIPPERMPDCINRVLPSDIRVIKGQAGAAGFDSCRSAKRKTYCYSLYVSERELPLKERYAVRIEHAPPLSDLEKAAKLFEGEHDFKAFCASGSAVKTTVRTVYEVKVEEGNTLENRDIRIYVTGNGFLYNMVRTMAGELLELASGRRSKDSLEEAFRLGKRDLLGKTMPAKGLTLLRVEYGEGMLL
jgi:tRNA pseudouridine38-40 synthase